MFYNHSHLQILQDSFFNHCLFIEDSQIPAHITPKFDFPSFCCSSPPFQNALSEKSESTLSTSANLPIHFYSTMTDTLFHSDPRIGFSLFYMSFEKMGANSPKFLLFRSGYDSSGQSFDSLPSSPVLGPL